jgi:putative DNA primase/helicase
MKKRTPIKLTKSGVFLVTTVGKKRIAAAIRFKAIGHRVVGGKTIAMAEIQFVNRKGKKKLEYFDMSGTTTRNRHKIIDALADADYRWPTQRTLPERIIENVLAIEPDQSFTMVGAPGWYDAVILNSLRQYGKGRRFILDPNAGANVAKITLGQGSLGGWQKTVAKTAKKSSRLRLMIGAAFGAVLLRPLGIDSFALNLFGLTSTGKTKGGLFTAGSVVGLLGENGLPGWADSIPGLEQLAVGHRDSILPLDDAGDGDGGPLPVHEKARLLAFAFARGRGRNLDKSYEKKANRTLKEFKVIALSTSESALKAIAEGAAKPRIGGEEVRFIDVPSAEPDSPDIFDDLQLSAGEDRAKVGQKLVNELRRDSIKNQGFAMDAFLKRLSLNPTAAVKKAKAHMEEFESQVPRTLVTGADHRITTNFSVIYAGAALAIEYGILPWKKKATRAAIAKCMAAAFATIRNPSPPPFLKVEARSIGTVAAKLKDDLDRLTLVDRI